MHEYYNKRWYEFTGTSVEHTLGEGWIQMFHPDDRERAWQHWQHSLSTGEPYEIEYRLLKHTGEFVWVLGRAAPIYNLNGEIIKWFGTCTDIHEQKMLQQQKEDFISIASHELKTPLTSLSASLQFLERQVKKEPALDPMTSKLVNSARTHLNKLTGLVKDLLDFSKIERGQLILQKSLFSISEMIDSCCDTIRMDGFKITLTGDTEAKVSADYLKVEQVIVNLLNNCVKYASQSKEIIIHTEQIDGFLKISVRDFGPGIPKEKLPHLFDVYYRAEKKGNQNSGLGLGLYICAQIIDEHGGVMGVDSELGQGSTFWFTLPLS
jgi:PAS domain S-box-containing protein